MEQRKRETRTNNGTKIMQMKYKNRNKWNKERERE
jgi:hypothetical protein